MATTELKSMVTAAVPNRPCHVRTTLINQLHVCLSCLSYCHIHLLLCQAFHVQRDCKGNPGPVPFSTQVPWPDPEVESSTDCPLESLVAGAAGNEALTFGRIEYKSTLSARVS